MRFLALLGLLGPPFAIVTLFGFLYAHYGDIALLQRMFVGVAAAAAGLTISTSLRMWQPLLRERPGAPHGIALATLAGVGIMRWPIYWVLRCGAAAEHRLGMVGATMSHDPGILLTLAGNFALMSLFAIGGANAALPEMHRLAVEVMHWMTDRQFADLFAIAQVTPGPNVIVVTLIGYQVAGLAGALVATLAMCGPTCVFAFFVGQVWDRFKEARWRLIIQAGPGPDLARSARRQHARDRARGRAVLADRGADAGDRRGHLPVAVEPALDLRHRGGPWPGRGGLARAWKRVWLRGPELQAATKRRTQTSGLLQKVVAIASRALLECANDAWCRPGVGARACVTAGN